MDTGGKKIYCPLCREKLILKNEILFCLSCKIYIGKPETFHISFGVNSHYFHQDHEFLYKRKEEETVGHVFFSYIVIFIAVVVILFLALTYFYKPYVEKIQKQEQFKLNKNL